MTRKAISIYMAATCAIVIVAPGRFVCGIVIAIELICLMLFGLLLKSLLKKMNLEKIEQVLILSFVIFFTVFFKQILVQIMPVIALQLSFVIFLPSISTFTTVFLLEDACCPGFCVIHSVCFIAAGYYWLWHNNSSGCRRTF